VLAGNGHASVSPGAAQEDQRGHQPAVHDGLEGVAGELGIDQAGDAGLVEVGGSSEEVGGVGGGTGCRCRALRLDSGVPRRPAGLDEVTHGTDAVEVILVVVAVAGRRARSTHRSVATLPRAERVLGDAGEFGGLLDGDHDARIIWLPLA